MLCLRAFCVAQKQCGYRCTVARKGALSEAIQIQLTAFLPGLPSTCGVYLILPDDVYMGLANMSPSPSVMLFYIAYRWIFQPPRPSRWLT